MIWIDTLHNDKWRWKTPVSLLGIEQYPEYRLVFSHTVVSKSQALNTTYKSQIIATLKIKNINITDEIIKGAEQILEEIPTDKDHPFGVLSPHTR